MKIKSNLLLAAGLLLAGSLFTACNSDGDNFDYNKNGLLISGTESVPLQKFVVENTPSTYSVTVKATKKVDTDVQVKLAIDPSLVEKYNQENGTSFFPIPDGSAVLENSDAVIKAGTALSTAANVKVVNTDNFKDGRVYLIPVTISNVSGGNEDVIEASKTLFLRISRVISFYALETDPEASSNYIFDDSKRVDLDKYTIEFKVYSYGFGRVGDIKRVLTVGGKNGEEANMFRFGENGSAGGDILQWVLPGGRCFSTTHFQANRWYLISCTYDGTTFTMYVDGVKDASTTGSGKCTPFEAFELGMSWGGYRHSQFFNGRMAEVRVWHRALSASEIANGIAGVDPASDGLVAYWKMNEPSGHIFKDATGHGYDMDWTDTYRDDNEDGSYIHHDYSMYIKRVFDDKNKCAQ